MAQLTPFRKSSIFFLLIVSVATASVWIRQAGSSADPDLQISERIKNEILLHGEAYSNLRELVAGGPRLSGSAGAARAVEWAKAKMQGYGFDRVTLQPVQVPHWERGKVETATVKSAQGVEAAYGRNAFNESLRITALGNSVGTPAGGLEAPVIEVQGLDEVSSLGDQVRGKIVFYNRPMNATLVDTFEAYGAAGDQRFAGARRAAKFGAAAVLVRSLSLSHDEHPHTGMTRYDVGGRLIPAAALSTASADRLSAILKKNPDARVRMELSARPLDPVPSFNVLGELTGTELPNEIVVVGGHLDSWDLGPGAHDDGAGVVQSIEVLRALEHTPRRTLRAVLFMAEENGGIGGREYARLAAANSREKHVAALESDRGGFTPRGFSVSGGPASLDRLKGWAKYLAVTNADQATQDAEGGTDIGPLGASGTILYGLVPDSQRYFDVHHAETDTIEAVNPRELHLSAAAMATLCYLLTE